MAKKQKSLPNMDSTMPLAPIEQQNGRFLRFRKLGTLAVEQETPSSFMPWTDMLRPLRGDTCDEQPEGVPLHRVAWLKLLTVKAFQLDATSLLFFD